MDRRWTRATDSGTPLFRGEIVKYRPQKSRIEEKKCFDRGANTIISRHCPFYIWFFRPIYYRPMSRIIQPSDLRMLALTNIYIRLQTFGDTRLIDTCPFFVCWWSRRFTETIIQSKIKFSNRIRLYVKRISYNCITLDLILLRRTYYGFRIPN